MLTLENIARRLREAGIENPWREARLLVAFASEQQYTETLTLRKHIPLNFCGEALEAAVARRCAREPLTKIIGKANFWKHEFVTTRDTMDPRPESEVMISGVLRHFGNREAELAFLDMGTGTGCLLLSCLCEYKNSVGVGLDKSLWAINVAKQNAKLCGVDERAAFFERDWNDGIADFSGVAPLTMRPKSTNCGEFRKRPIDVILCNPPYISTTAVMLPPPLDATELAGCAEAATGAATGAATEVAKVGVSETEVTTEIEELAPELSFDPALALFAGVDGLDAYRDLLAIIKRDVADVASKTSEALLFLEIGRGQHNSVEEIAKHNGFVLLETLCDIGKIPRILVFRLGNAVTAS